MTALPEIAPAGADEPETSDWERSWPEMKIWELRWFAKLIGRQIDIARWQRDRGRLRINWTGGVVISYACRAEIDRHIADQEASHAKMLAYLAHRELLTAPTAGRA